MLFLFPARNIPPARREKQKNRKGKEGKRSSLPSLRLFPFLCGSTRGGASASLARSLGRLPACLLVCLFVLFVSRCLYSQLRLHDSDDEHSGLGKDTPPAARRTPSSPPLLLIHPPCDQTEINTPSSWPSHRPLLLLSLHPHLSSSSYIPLISLLHILLL
ncbi:hypothetical protein BC939DRAFT_102263 [Gamsiella multidivaricata]|uniref:uncharacterized protein n=1 Tax=Gamsiella multidivaricata TaxID=101098 RepID=UPI00221F1D1D|nr:uncharacterized protein BC939DRAFT_102263 [Gamsiella multidivaricata]KAI7832373.1 hypothetical protein BC939DRAFT_102263 [Gamsiella multidivaricata]